MAGALTGIKVIDLSRILAGPFASQTLGDMGAEVLKIEHPSGDDTRQWGPPFVTRADGSVDAAYFFCCNRNKTSLCLDFSHADQRAQLLELIREADVLIENYKVGGLAKYGLDYASLKSLNPALIYCSITGFGQTGPYKNRPGYDALIQGMGGLMSITGEPDGAPQKVGVAVVDLMTGLYASTAILAALHHRSQTGLGQHIDLAIGNDAQFAAWCRAAGLALHTDARFITNSVRVQNRALLEQLLHTAMSHQTIDEWVALGEQHGFPCGPINSIDRVFADQQLHSRGMVVGTGSERMVGNPIRFSDTPITDYEAPPTHERR